MLNLDALSSAISRTADAMAHARELREQHDSDQAAVNALVTVLEDALSKAAAVKITKPAVVPAPKAVEEAPSAPLPAFLAHPVNTIEHAIASALANSPK